MSLELLFPIILILCGVTDFLRRKIYNIVIFPGIFIAFGLHLLNGGITSVTYALLGFLVGFSILFVPYLFGGMGAGDVKLLALIGAFKGSVFVIETAVYMAVIGGILALFILLFRKGTIQRFKALFYFFYARKHGLKIPMFLDKEALSTTYPYGLAIVAGAFINLTFYQDLSII